MIAISLGALLIVALILALLSLFPTESKFPFLSVAVVIVIIVLLVSAWPIHLPALIRVR